MKAGPLCIECRRETADRDADGYRYFFDGVGDLLPFCPNCAAREFGVRRLAEQIVDIHRYP